MTGKLEKWSLEENEKTRLQIYKIPVTKMTQADFERLVKDIKTLWALIRGHTIKSVRKNTLNVYDEFLSEHGAEIENYTNWEDIVEKLQEFVGNG